jgi:cell division protein FtsB
MEREDAKDLTLSILVVVAVALLGYCVWLHVKCASLNDSLVRLSADVEQLSARQTMIADKVEKHHAIKAEPPEQSLSDQAKEAYNKIKSAAAAGYQAAKDEFNKK